VKQINWVAACGLVTTIALCPYLVPRARAAAPASDTACNDNGSNGSNGGTGFGAWSTAIAVGGGTYTTTDNTISNATCATAWGTFTGTNTTTATSQARPFTSAASTNAIQSGQQVSVMMCNGGIAPGGSEGLSLWNASNNAVLELIFDGGSSTWSINDSTGFHAPLPSIPYAGGSVSGLLAVVRLTSSTTYSLTVAEPANRASGVQTVYGPYTGTLANPSGGQAITQLRFFTFDDGSGNNLQFNDLNVTCPDTVAFTTQPASLTVPTNDVASFSADTFGDSVTYQWQSSPDGSLWTSIASGTNGCTVNATNYESFVLVAAATNSFQYRAIATDACGNTATSSVATLTVAATIAAGITTQPASTSVCSNSAATFGVTASGSSLGYAWLPSSNLGWGAGNAWSVSASNAGSGVFIGSSTNNDGVDTPCTGFGGNDINSPSLDRALGMFGPIIKVLRQFPSTLAAGQWFSIDMDNGDVDTGVQNGFSLHTSSGADDQILFSFYFPGGARNYRISDATGEHDTGIRFTRTGLRIQMLMGPAVGGTNTYTMFFQTNQCGAATAVTNTFSGLFKTDGPAGAVLLFNNNNEGGSANDMYFNNIIAGGAYDNANNYSLGNWVGSNNGDLPITGATSSSYTLNSAQTNNAAYFVIVTNAAGSIVSSTAKVTINVDTQAPVLSGCPSDLVVQCYSRVPVEAVVTATDNCDTNVVVGFSEQQSNPGSSCSNVITRTWMATDSSGNSASCSQTILVNDTTPPVISCPATVTTNTDLGQCTASNVVLGSASATDNCSSNVTVINNAPTLFPKGTNAVVWTATDGCGNSAVCTQLVIVVDNQAPTITCPANIVTSADPGQCSKSNVTYTATATDNCANMTLSYNPPSGSTFPIGTTTVYVNATDASANYAGITVFGVINTVAGNGSIGYSGDGEAATNASLDNPYRVAVDSSGNLFFDDLDNQRIRRVDAVTGIITTVAGNGNIGYSGDGGAATNATLNSPTAVELDGSGNLFIADYGNSCIRRVDAVTGIITTVAGDGNAGYNGDGRAATSARLKFPYGVALDSVGNLFIADSGNQRIRRVDAVTGFITTVAGNGIIGFSGDGGAATNAMLNGPFSAALDRAGNLFIADFYNARIRRVEAATGIITTVAGTGLSGYSGDGVVATTTKLFGPFSVALDSAGNLFIADWFNYRIRRVDADTGIITTAAGNGNAGYSGDGGVATNASLNDPTGVAVDPVGNLFIDDLSNNRIRRVAVAACTFTVTVNDTEPPSIICPTNIVTSTTAGTCVASDVTWTVTAADNCTNVTVSCTPASGSSFPKGTTTVVCTATDSSGNTNSCSFTVTVNDMQPPVISTCASNQTLSANGSCWAALPNLTSQVVATDNCGGTPTVTQTPAAGTLLGLGTNSVTFTVNDGRGNSNSCTAMVIVRDVTPPVITCPTDVLVNADPGQCFATGVVLVAPAASDNCGVATVVNNALSTYPVGTNFVVWTATDGSGNSATCTQLVIVVDNQPPTITCPTDVSVMIPDEMTCACDVPLGNAAATDNCGLASVVNNAPNCYSVGTNIVVWTATDMNDNVSICTQRVCVARITLDSSNVRIVAIKAIGNDIDLTWETFGNTTNVIQLATPIISGNFTNNYIPLGTVVVPGSGAVITNWVDFGGATNVPSRYYRIRLQPGPSCGP